MSAQEKEDWEGSSELKAFREDVLKISQSEIADILGINQRTYAHYEKGVVPSLTAINGLIRLGFKWKFIDNQDSAEPRPTTEREWLIHYQSEAKRMEKEIAIKSDEIKAYLTECARKKTDHDQIFARGPVADLHCDSATGAGNLTK